MPATSPPPLVQTTTSSSAGRGRLPVGDLEAHGALAGDDIGIVEGRHQHRATLGREPCRDLLAALLQPVVLDDLGAERERVAASSRPARRPA